jgi:hypothetical protein
MLSNKVMYMAPCISSINLRGGSGLTVQQSGSATQPVYTIVPEAGYYIPKLGSQSASANFAAGSSISPATPTVGAANTSGSVSCTSGYHCTSDRGRIELVATRNSTIGKIARVQTKLVQGEICSTTQNGGTSFFGIGSRGKSTTGFDITSGVAVSGKILIDYFCHWDSLRSITVLHEIHRCPKSGSFLTTLLEIHFDNGRFDVYRG